MGKAIALCCLASPTPSADDKGRNLFSAVTAGAPLTPVRNVRPDLDVVPGGRYVRRIASVLSAEMATKDDANRVHLALAECLQNIAGDYRLIIIDTPPENPLLSNIALCAGRFVIVPMRTDEYLAPGTCATSPRISEECGSTTRT